MDRQSQFFKDYHVLIHELPKDGQTRSVFVYKRNEARRRQNPNATIVPFDKAQVSELVEELAC
jgi:peroxiredoxin